MTTLLRLLFIFGLSVEYSNCISLQEPIKLTESYHIQPYHSERSLYSDFGVIPGTRKCGGSGRLLHFRYEQCVTGLPPPCVFSINKPGRSELAFIPNEDSKGLGVRTTVTTSDGFVKAYDNPLPDASTLAGREYALHTAGAPTPELKGKQFTMRREIYRLSDKHVDICAEADVYVDQS